MRRHTRLVVEKQLLDAAAVAPTSRPWTQTLIFRNELLLGRVSGGLEVGFHLDEPFGMTKGTQGINIKTRHLCEAGEAERGNGENERARVCPRISGCDWALKSKSVVKGVIKR